MKSLIHSYGKWALCSLLLGSCREHDAPATQHPRQQPAPVEPDSLPRAVAKGDAPQARADFGGFWLNATYVAQLRQTRSPRRADGKWGESGVTLLYLDPRSFQGDSLRVEVGYGNHEGAPPHYLRLRPGYAGAVLPAAADRSLGLPPLGLRYQVQGPDTVLYLHEAVWSGQQARATPFRKVWGLPVYKNNFDLPFKQFINRQILAGTHAATDSAGNASVVRFTAEGQVVGLPAHRRYWVNFDFVGPFKEYDFVVFDHGQPAEEVLAFVSRGDTLCLYRVLDDTATYKRRLGNLRFTLVRQNK